MTQSVNRQSWQLLVTTYVILTSLPFKPEPCDPPGRPAGERALMYARKSRRQAFYRAHEPGATMRPMSRGGPSRDSRTMPQSEEGGAYAQAGVDMESASRGLAGLVDQLRTTFGERPSGAGQVLTDFGHYAGVIDLGGGLALAISTDGVGSKILVAEAAGAYAGLGQDLIAMNANDVICVGAEPLAMVDYIATEALDPGVLAEFGRGLTRGARAARITIPAGEIAQLPEMVRGARPGSGLDLVGTCVGLVPKDRILSGDALAGGDQLIALASSGLHANGYTLARRVLFEEAGLTVASCPAELDRPLGEALLEPTTIYVRAALDILQETAVKAMAHITGDGLKNLLRWAPPVSFAIEALPEPPAIFQLIQRRGAVDLAEMYEVFNMGIGLVVVVPPQDAERVIEIAGARDHPAWRLGQVIDDGRRAVDLIEHQVSLAAGRRPEPLGAP